MMEEEIKQKNGFVEERQSLKDVDVEEKKE